MWVVGGGHGSSSCVSYRVLLVQLVLLEAIGGGSSLSSEYFLSRLPQQQGFYVIGCVGVGVVVPSL